MDALTELKQQLRELEGVLCLATRHSNVIVTAEALAQECEKALAGIHKFKYAELMSKE